MESPERTPPADPQDRLDSWKEIAAYLDRDVRTVQRWEKGEGLPVHRHLHDRQGSIFAFKGELEAWRLGRSLPPEPGPATPPPAVPAPAGSPPDPPAAKDGKGRRPWLRRALLASVLLAGSALVVFRSDLGRGARVPSVAVLPFANLSGDARQEYLSEGLTEELVTQLGRQEGDRSRVVAVRPLRGGGKDARRPRQVAAELGVDFLLEGSVRRAGDRVRVAVHLVRARDEAHLWDESYDRDMGDLLGLQREVAEAIAAGIGQKLPHPGARSPRPVRPEAYEAYLRGRFHWNRRTPGDLLQALDAFGRAAALDPGYAPIHVGIADCYALLGSAELGALPPTEALPLAKAEALKALALDEGLAEAHASLAHIHLVYDWDLPAAEREFHRALALNPGSPTAHQWFALLLLVTGRGEAALAELRKAEALDPRSPVLQAALAEAAYFGRRFEAAEAHARRALDLDPAFMLGRVNLGRALVMLGRHDEAIQVFQTAREVSGQAPGLTMFLGWAWAGKGDAGRARELLAELERPPRTGARPRYIPAVYPAALHGALKEPDATFAHLDRALGERCEYLIYLGQEPMADPLRGDPRFAALVKAVGLP